jgi:hypothetical protein
MDMQTSSQGGLANSFWIQTAVLVIVAAIVIALAAKYVW